MLTFWKHHLTRLAVLLESGEGGVLLLDPPTTPGDLAASTAAALGIAKERVEILRSAVGAVDPEGHRTPGRSMTNDDIAKFSRILKLIAPSCPAVMVIRFLVREAEDGTVVFEHAEQPELRLGWPIPSAPAAAELLRSAVELGVLTKKDFLATLDAAFVWGPFKLARAPADAERCRADPPDWTRAIDARTSSSPLFQRLVNELTAHLHDSAALLLSGRAREVAAQAVSHLAHRFGVGPAWSDATIPEMKFLSGGRLSPEAQRYLDLFFKAHHAKGGFHRRLVLDVDDASQRLAASSWLLARASEALGHGHAADAERWIRHLVDWAPKSEASFSNALRAHGLAEGEVQEAAAKVRAMAELLRS